MTKLFLWNPGHNSDIIFTRPLVGRMLARYPDVRISWGCWRNHELLLRDLPISVIPHTNDDIAPIDLSPLCPPDFAPICLYLGLYPDTRQTCWRNIVEV